MGAWSTWWAGPTVKGKTQRIVWRTVKVSVSVISCHPVLSICHPFTPSPSSCVTPPPLAGLHTCSVQHPAGCITQEHGCPAGPPPAPPWEAALQAAQPQSCGAAVPQRPCGGERTHCVWWVRLPTWPGLLCLHGPTSSACMD